jgi:Spy/CpxP family protein refolding chaperone
MRNIKSLKTTAYISIALAALLVLPAIALAGPGKWGHGHRGPHGDPGPGEMLRMLAAHLELSEEQRAQVRALAEEHRESTRALRDRIRDARRSLHETIQADDYSEDAIRAAAAVLAAAEADMAVARASHRKDFEALLTPEQKEELQRIKDEHGPGMKGKGKGAGPHGFGDCPFHDD